MSKPTRADREAFAREYWPGGIARGTSGDVWIETGRGGNPAWDAGARAVASQRAELAMLRGELLEAKNALAEKLTLRLMNERSERRQARAELLRLAAQVAVKVGEHEYARGRRDGYQRGYVAATAMPALGALIWQDAQWTWVRQEDGSYVVRKTEAQR